MSFANFSFSVNSGDLRAPVALIWPDMQPDVIHSHCSDCSMTMWAHVHPITTII